MPSSREFRYETDEQDETLRSLEIEQWKADILRTEARPVLHTIREDVPATPKVYGLKPIPPRSRRSYILTVREM